MDLVTAPVDFEKSLVPACRVDRRADLQHRHGVKYITREIELAATRCIWNTRSCNFGCPALSWTVNKRGLSVDILQ